MLLWHFIRVHLSPEELGHAMRSSGLHSSSIEAASETLLLDLLYTQLQIPGDKQVTLEKIISDLETSKQPHLIVFDNFETPWNGNQTQVGNILRRLDMLDHIAILVTMRGKHAPCHNSIKWQSIDIKSTDEAASLRIYI